MLAQGWPVVDRYRNTTRGDMPADETITSFADRLIDLAERVITERDGARRTRDGRIHYRIRTEQPRCIYPLVNPSQRTTELKAGLGPDVDRDIATAASRERLARAAYIGICLDLSSHLRERHPERWSAAIEAMSEHENVVQAIFYHSPTPRGEILRRKAVAAGLEKPRERRRLW
jgi:hypothetical protein